MKPDTDVREWVLDEAKRCVTQDRNVEYDEPDRNFRRIADRWSAWLWGRGYLPRGVFLETWDVAIMSSDIKDGRIMHSPQHPDSWVDRAGYSACGAQCAGVSVEAIDTAV